MDLKTILTFQRIVELGTFQRASQELNYAQSTITTHIKNLEEELGVVLLERGRTLKLTEAGEVFYEKGKLLLKGYEQLKDAMNEVIDAAAMIHIGVMEPFASLRLPAILQKFKQQHPHVKVKVSIDSNSRLLQLVQEEAIDFAICAATEVPNDFTFTPFLEEKVMLLAQSDNPLVQQATLSLKELESHPLLITAVNCPFRQHFEHEALKQNFFPIYAMEISQVMAIKQYVLSRNDLAIVPEITVQNAPQNTTALAVRQLERGVTVGILERTYKNKDTQLMAEFIQLVYSEFLQTN